MKKLLFILFFIPIAAAAQNIFVNYSAPYPSPPCSGGHQTSGCGGQTSITDARDGQVYSIVQIGTQCWMAQNLNYGTYAPVTTPQIAGTKFCQNLSTVNDASCPFGGLYEWSNMMNGSSSCNGDSACPPCLTAVRGVCPAGWHIPSHYEWTLLEKNAGTNPGAFPYNLYTFGWLGTDEGGNLKQTGTSNWISPNMGAANTSGFTALPCGDSDGGSFYDVGGHGYWWSATESGVNAWDRALFYTEARVSRATYNKSFGFSVRCVKD